MREHEILKWKLLVSGMSAAPPSGASPELDNLYELYLLTCVENGWEPESRESFEQQYREETRRA